MPGCPKLETAAAPSVRSGDLIAIAAALWVKKGTLPAHSRVCQTGTQEFSALPDLVEN
eukprot:CAMPEP_0171058628 /NCGR_PEP_ID=MMETSP0766_2-20121228/2626_1 /TAXON_ID=439317 /ORGANISM="Gambierdiscus australes, Strain CAWD 149" /LENGTH=57 /DNA_ID=CAMNT_0011513933 /DNA_START=85 /DNA_END=256 /DNA_ORIENTATION=+